MVLVLIAKAIFAQARMYSKCGSECANTWQKGVAALSAHLFKFVCYRHIGSVELGTLAQLVKLCVQRPDHEN